MVKLQREQGGDADIDRIENMFGQVRRKMSEFVAMQASATQSLRSSGGLFVVNLDNRVITKKDKVTNIGSLAGVKRNAKERDSSC